MEYAQKALKDIADEIKIKGIPEEIQPLIIGFSGYGNVSQGAQEVFDIFPHKELSPEELMLGDKLDEQSNMLYKVVFKEKDLVERIDPSRGFELQEYYKNPERYGSKFEQYIPKLSVLMNCIFWDIKYPRLITLDYLKQSWQNETPKLKIIGDVSCDIDGAIQCTTKSTDPGNPVYTYDPLTDKVQDGVVGNGPVIMAVDNLPCELAAEASQAFSQVLVDFVPQLLEADFDSSHKDLNLPQELLSALILHNGQLTKDYEYLKKYL